MVGVEVAEASALTAKRPSQRKIIKAKRSLIRNLKLLASGIRTSFKKKSIRAAINGPLFFFLAWSS